MPSVTECVLDRVTASASSDEVGMGIYTLKYWVTTDGAMGPKSVVNGAMVASPHPVPTLWMTYSYLGDTDDYSFARDYEIERAGSIYRYAVTVTYRPPDSGDGALGGVPVRSEPNPIDRAAVIWWDREVNTKLILKDREGKAILNKIGDYYPTDIEIEDPRGILVVEFNVATLGEVYSLKREFDGAVNDEEVLIDGETVQARAVLCREVSSSPPITEQGYTYLHVVMRFAFAEEGGTWDYPQAEVGEYYWTKTGSDYDMLNGHRRVSSVGKIICLDEDGTRLEDDEPAVFTNWRIRREVDFTQIAIFTAGGP